MPYIANGEREAFDKIIDQLSAIPGGIEDSGELNFLFTRVAQVYLNQHGLRYKNLNDIIGALEGAKLELYRRVAANYEDTKIVLNGDVYK